MWKPVDAWAGIYSALYGYVDISVLCRWNEAIIVLQISNFHKNFFFNLLEFDFLSLASVKKKKIERLSCIL